jgi:hypothetical protein
MTLRYAQLALLKEQFIINHRIEEEEYVQEMKVKIRKKRKVQNTNCIHMHSYPQTKKLHFLANFLIYLQFSCKHKI